MPRKAPLEEAVFKSGGGILCKNFLTTLGIYAPSLGPCVGTVKVKNVLGRISTSIDIPKQ